MAKKLRALLDHNNTTSNKPATDLKKQIILKWMKKHKKHVLSKVETKFHEKVTQKTNAAKKTQLKKVNIMLKKLKVMISEKRKTKKRYQRKVSQ